MAALMAAGKLGSHCDGHWILAHGLRGFGIDRRPVLLDSAAGWPRAYSLLAVDPVIAELPQTIAELADLAQTFQLAEQAEAVPGPFQGGFIGALSYDLGVQGESLVLPEEPWGWPHIVGGFYSDFFVYLAQADRMYLVLGESEGELAASLEERREALLAKLRSGLAQPPSSTVSNGPLDRHTPSALHEQRIEEVRRRIGRGEFYQANLAHCFSGSIQAEPVELYLRLRSSNPAPYAGYMSWGSGTDQAAILSSSPELLLELTEVDGRRQARSRPIKGTAPRSADELADRKLAKGLLASEKDRAELAMIVDLARNDLGRTAQTGSVKVEEFPALRSYQRVHHLTADVVAQPRDECDAWTVLAAVFPGGSVTGAPKLASMSAIAELEAEGRGFFCGSLGFVDVRGQASFNLLIRTVTWRSSEAAHGETEPLPPRGEVSFRVGGGITFSSDSAAEDAETLAKASGMMAAFESSPNTADQGEHQRAPETSRD